MRKRITIPLLLIALFISTVSVIWNATYTVASDERHDVFHDITYGYQIEKYYCWNSMKITFWNNRNHFTQKLIFWKSSSIFAQMNTTFILSQLTIDKVVEQRWLKDDQAIYLNLQIKYHDSAVSVHPAKIIYDFHRGEIHTSSGFTLWRNWNPKNKTDDWMTETEFEDVLDRLSRE